MCVGGVSLGHRCAMPCAIFAPCSSHLGVVLVVASEEVVELGDLVLERLWRDGLFRGTPQIVHQVSVHVSKPALW